MGSAGLFSSSTYLVSSFIYLERSLPLHLLTLPNLSAFARSLDYLSQSAYTFHLCLLPLSLCPICHIMRTAAKRESVDQQLRPLPFVAKAL
jgi:hypothetical protein